VSYFFNLKKLPMVNNRPLGENSPNLVALALYNEDYCFAV
jgi:hypothetical protein